MSGSKLSRNGSSTEWDLPTIEEAFRISLDASKARRERELRIRRRMYRLELLAVILVSILVAVLVSRYG